jgi:hypothetical protein
MEEQVSHQAHRRSTRSLTHTIDADATRLKDKINSLVLQQRTSVILNLAEITFRHLTPRTNRFGAFRPLRPRQQPRSSNSAAAVP